MSGFINTVVELALKSSHLGFTSKNQTLVEVPQQHIQRLQLSSGQVQGLNKTLALCWSKTCQASEHPLRVFLCATKMQKTFSCCLLGRAFLVSQPHTWLHGSFYLTGIENVCTRNSTRSLTLALQVWGQGQAVVTAGIYIKVFLQIQGPLMTFTGQGLNMKVVCEWKYWQSKNYFPCFIYSLRMFQHLWACKITLSILAARNRFFSQK